MKNEKLKKVRTDFIKSGIIPKGVRPEIMQSWERCRKLGLEKTKIENLMVDKKELNDILLRNNELIEVSIPIMENILKSILNTSTILALADTSQCILKVVGDKAFRKWDGFNTYKTGSRWLESQVGTNAMTLAMILNRPVQTIGEEHYLAEHAEYTCSGVPIHSEKGEIIGSLNSINYMDAFSDYTLGMMVAAVKVIEKQITLISHRKFFEHSFESIREGVVLTDESNGITYVNKSACNILKIDKKEILGMPIGKLLINVNLDNLTKRITDRRLFFNVKGTQIPFVTNINIVTFNQKLSGISIIFKEEKSVNKSINTMIGNKANYSFENIVTENIKMQKIINEAEKLAKTDCSILITGESGTGKELFAQSIHNASNRPEGPFVALNCAALPRNLVESELFGYEEGAFTGAKKTGFVGKFELANGGTLFLDEIGELPIEVQAKLLRVLDSKKICRLGGEHEQSVDVRVVSATNKDLEQDVEDKYFRLDLYYRLSVVSFEIPPLRDRVDDVKLLCKHFLKKMNDENSDKIKTMSDAYFEKLMNYQWKGNVRQLQNIVARSYYLCDGNILTAESLPEIITKKENAGYKKENPIENMEKKMILDALRDNHGNVTRSATSLNMSKPTMYRKIEKYGISVNRSTIIDL